MDTLEPAFLPDVCSRVGCDKRIDTGQVFFRYSAVTGEPGDELVKLIGFCSQTHYDEARTPPASSADPPNIKD